MSSRLRGNDGKRVCRCPSVVSEQPIEHFIKSDDIAGDKLQTVLVNTYNSAYREDIC